MTDTGPAYLSHGGLSYDLGLTLLIAALVVAAFVDPWSLRYGVDQDASMRAREAQFALMRAGFMQLLLGKVLSILHRDKAYLGIAVIATVAGSLGTVAGHTLRFFWMDHGYIVTASALVGLSGFAILSIAARRHPRRLLRLMLPVAVGGLILEAVHGLAISDAAFFQLGATDELRLRLLRLSCMAAMALPLLAVLGDELAQRSSAEGIAQRWGPIALMVGAIGLPVSLVAATFIDLRLKYLLPPFADALLLGVVLGWWLARRLTASGEVWGWGLIAMSMTAGLLMGGYAFDGPLEPPRVLGEYVDVGRQVSRVIHVYAMVFGFLLIIGARGAGPAQKASMVSSARTLLIAALATPTLLLLQLILDLPVFVLSIGPAIVMIAALQWLRERFVAVVRAPDGG